MNVAYRGPFRVPMAERLEPRIEVGVEPGDCWPWTGYIMPNGYGKLTVQGRRSNLAHRLAYETFVGPIPAGLDLDHLCRVRHCVNPDHLEPVTRSENLRRSPLPNNGGAFHRSKTHCPQGHPYDRENTRWYRNERTCKTCRVAHSKAAYERRKQKGGGPPT